jgi:hypothetical protein
MVRIVIPVRVEEVFLNATDMEDASMESMEMGHAHAMWTSPSKDWVVGEEIRVRHAIQVISGEIGVRLVQIL